LNGFHKKSKNNIIISKTLDTLNDNDNTIQIEKEQQKCYQWFEMKYKNNINYPKEYIKSPFSFYYFSSQCFGNNN